MSAFRKPEQGVWLTRNEDGSYRTRYIGLFLESNNDLAVIVRKNTDGSLFGNYIQGDDRRMNNLRMGALLYCRAMAGRPVSK